MSELLKGKRVLVTGGARGIGFEIAKAMALNGAQVIINDVRNEALSEAVNKIKKDGVQFEAIAADITDKEAVDKMFDKIKQNGGLDVLVNNAGLSIRGVHALNTGETEHEVKDITTIGLEDWQGVMKINLTGTFLSTKAAVPLLKESPEGRIINISSKAGRSGGSVSDLAYVTSKAGLIGFTKQCAIELGGYGITSNAVAPGIVMSEWLQAHWNSLSDERKAQLENGIPLKRTGQPSEIANVCLFLASNLSSYTNGATIDVNGGAYMG